MTDHRRPNQDDRVTTVAKALVHGFPSWEETPVAVRDEASRHAEVVLEALDSRLAPPVLAADWPSRTELVGPVPARLTCFLYLLLRDYVQPGDAEQAALQSRDATGEHQYGNPHLLGYALALNTYLMGGPADSSDDYPAPDESLIEIARADELELGDLMEISDESGRWRQIMVAADRDGTVVVKLNGHKEVNVYGASQEVRRVRKEHLS